jgi:ABC-type multidrug transport system fused ATPase/permease subunit
MYTKLWRLLNSFHRDYIQYIVAVILRQSLLVGGGYALIWSLRYCLQHAGAPEWLFMLGFVAFDAGLLGLDLGLNKFYNSRLGYPIFGHLRTAALAKVFEMPLEWHHRQDSGVLVGRVNNGVGKVVQTAEAIGRELGPALIRTGLSLVPLVWLSPIAAPIIGVALIGFVWLTVIENRERSPLRQSRYNNYGKDYGLFAESVQYVKPVIQFGQTGSVLRRYHKVQEEIIQDGLTETRLANRYAWRRNLILSVAKRCCQGIWVWQYRSGSLDAAMVLYLNMITEELLNSFWSYASLMERLYDGVEPTRVLVELLQEKPAIQDSSDVVMRPVPASIDIDMVGISFSYSRGHSVMENFNLHVKPGTVLGVAGPSGGGKTTIHNLLSRMFEVHSGKILVAGENIRRWPLDRLRGLFSYVSQSDGVFLSEATMLETIRFGRPEASFEEIVSAATSACIHEDILRMPNGYWSTAGQRGVTLSKGQQQRIALAQALVALTDERKVLILDEFTSALDSGTEQRVLQNMRPYFAGRTVIIIAHRLSTIQNIADKIVVVQDGTIIESGSHAELVQNGGWYSKMAQIQAIA